MRAAGQIKRFKDLHDLPVMLHNGPPVVGREELNDHEQDAGGPPIGGWCGQLLSAYVEKPCPSARTLVSADQEYELSALSSDRYSHRFIA